MKNLEQFKSISLSKSALAQITGGVGYDIAEPEMDVIMYQYLPEEIAAASTKFDNGPSRKFDTGPSRKFDDGPSRKFDGGVVEEDFEMINLQNPNDPEEELIFYGI